MKTTAHLRCLGRFLGDLQEVHQDALHALEICRMPRAAGAETCAEREKLQAGGEAVIFSTTLVKND